MRYIPDIGKHCGAFGDEHAIVNVVFHHTVNEGFKTIVYKFTKGGRDGDSPPDGVVGCHLTKCVKICLIM